MMQTFAQGTLRVRTPPSYDARRAPAVRSPRGAAGHEDSDRSAIVAALEDSGLDLVEAIDLAPRRSSDPLTAAAPARHRAGTVRIELDLPPDQDAVILLEHDGAYSWHLPVPVGRPGTLRAELRTVTFEIAVRPQPAGRRKTPTGDRTRGGLADTVHGTAQALVFRFADPGMLERAVDRMEGRVRRPLGLGAGGEQAAMTMAEPPPAARMAPLGDAPTGADDTADEEGPGTPTAASLAAEMPASVVEKKAFDVRVRLSRKALTASSGTAHAESDVVVDAGRDVSVQVIGKSNATMTGPDSDVFNLPPGGGTSELVFQAKSLSAGPLVVLVVVRQGRIPIATLRLNATATGKSGAAVPASTVVASAHPGIDAPELDGLPCIDIVERDLPNGSVIYQYAVRLVPGADVAVFESKPIKDRVRRIGKILDDVTETCRESAGDPRERERRLQDIGAKMFDELFPVEMQAHLWKHRAKVKDLIVYADEPFVPWELVHLKPPNGPRPAKPRFLAQSGMVRWQLGSLPPREVRVRAGKARSLCPVYRDPRFALKDPVKERIFLEDRFGATQVTATPAGVRALLRSGAFDLLHFSGHGAADPDDILDAKVMLQGRKRGGTVVPEYLGATMVSENATPADAREQGPLVVLNACQVGRAGELLTTVGGFAHAFLEAGAAAFVSCLWSVEQEPSRVFVEKLYEELLAGQPMAVASARARETARKAGDATWLSFVVYSRPDAVLVTS